MKVWSIQRLFGGVGAAASETLSRGAGHARSTRAGSCAFRLCLGFLLTQASVLDGLSPFGVAFAAAQAPGAHALFAALGAALGYLVLGVDVGLRYIAVCILLVSAGMVFRGVKFASHPFFMPLTAFLLSLATGLMYWMSGGGEPVDMVYLVTELLLTLGCSYLFRTVMEGGESGEQSFESQRAGGFMLLFACSLLALSGFMVGGILSPARMAAICAVLLCAYRSGAPVGAAAGLCMGLVMDLGLGAPFYSMSYGSAGMLAGIFKRAGKLWSAMAFVCTGAISALWALNGSHRLSVLLEAFAASVIFMLINDGAFPRLNAVLNVRQEDNTMHAERLREYILSRLSGASDAFRRVNTSLSGALEHAAIAHTEGIEGVFDRATKEVCGRCMRVSQCWDTELPATCAALREAAKRSEARGRVDKNDLSGYFASRCMHFKHFIAVCNRELSNMLYRRQYQARVRESRGVLCRQYAEFARVLSDTADELARAPVFDTEAERRLSRWLQTRQLSPKVSVYATAGGRMCAELEGENLSILLTDKRDMARQASKALGWLVNEPEAVGVASLDRLTLWESEPVLATLGVAAHKRGGQSVSGDSGTYFKTDDGKLYVILADGMGSGAEAARDSREAVKQLEGFLRAGVSAESALEAMNSSLLLKGAEDSVFVTLDLLVTDLLEARLTTYKYGAAPTYIQQYGQTERVTGTALPGGLENGRAPDRFTQSMAGEQWVVMVSDGVTGSDDDTWLIDMVGGLGFDEAPRDAAAAILRQAMRHGGAADDMTVLALKTKIRRTR